VTHASNYIVGEILTQHDHLVAYHSETLSDLVNKDPKEPVQSSKTSLKQQIQFNLALRKGITTPTPKACKGRQKLVIAPP